MMKMIMAACLLLVCGAASALEEWTLSGEQWDRPRSGESVSSIKLIAGVVNRFDENEGMVLTINHPGGEAGSLWAYELRSWLITLGVPGHYIQLLPGGVSEDLLHIQLKGEMQ